MDQSRLALSLALLSAGGFDSPCTAAVPFLALPGLIISTVPGTIYPSNYAIAVRTSLPLAYDQQAAGQSLVSPVLHFSGVAGAGNRQVHVHLTGFPLSSDRKSSSCTTENEWRYKQLVPSSDTSTTCTCPANSLCSGQTSCTCIPEAGSRWAIVSVPTTVCTVTATSGGSGSELGLGLGLGLGLPALAVVCACVYFKFFSSGKGSPSEDARRTSDAGGPTSIDMVYLSPVEPSEQKAPRLEIAANTEGLGSAGLRGLTL
jgi:hypothetical protein